MSTDRYAGSNEPLDLEFGAQLRTQLEREANALDVVTAARLSAARHRALAVAGDGASMRWLPWLGGAVAASLLLAVLLGRGAQEPVAPASSAQSTSTAVQADVASPPAALIASDVAVIADLEFYDWLEEQDAVL